MNVLKYVDRIPLYWLIVGFLGLFYVTFTPNDNEEQYLQLSKLYMDGDWILNSINLTEFAGGRILFQWIVGSFMRHFTVEEVVFFGRAILLLCCAWPLVLIYKELRMSDLTALLHVVGFVFFRQAFFAGEWIFISVEAKCFAYVFVLFGFFYYLRKEYVRMMVLMVIATYFHILVGFYCFAYMALAGLFLDNGRYVKNLAIVGAVYVVAILPLVIFLSTSVKVPEGASVDPSWIYTYFRAPHHTALFKSVDYFLAVHAKGVAIALVSLGFSGFLLSKEKSGMTRSIMVFVVVTLVGALCAVVLAYFDGTGRFLKYYPFRISSLSLFGFLLMLLIIADRRLDFSRAPLFKWAVIFFALMVVRPVRSNIESVIAHYTHEPSEVEIIGSYIRSHSDRDAVVLYLDRKREDGDLSLTRHMERSSFVVRKFIPSDMARINDWYERVLARQLVMKEPGRLSMLVREYRVDLVVARYAVESDLLHEVLAVGPYRVYALAANGRSVAKSRGSDAGD